MLTYNFARIHTTVYDSATSVSSKNYGKNTSGTLCHPYDYNGESVLFGGNGSSTRPYFRPMVAGNYGMSYVYRAQYNTNYNSYANFYIDVGTGDTEPTKEDFKLESPQSGLTCLGITRPQDLQYGSNIIMRFSGTFENQGSSPVTVKEIGVFTGNRYAGPFLLARSVLSTPVTIEPGEAYTFTYSIEI